MTDNAEITNPSVEEENVPIVTFKRGKMRSRANLRTKENSDNEDEDKAKALVQSRAVATVLSESSTGTTITNSDSAVPSISSLATVFQSSNNADRFEYSGSSATATNQVESTDKNLTGGKQSQSKQGGAFGPMKAPSFLRATSRFDYQPNICKDYKETGFCGFGDSCIYLHDRSDYKAGWQLEKEWEVKQAAKKRKMQELENAMSKARAERRARREGKEGEEGEFDEIEEEAEEDVMKAIRAMQEEKEEEEKEEDGGRGGQGKGRTGEKEKDKEKEKELPFACFICRNPFTQPIVTSCGHYFCSQCAIDRYKTNTRCAVCDKPTFGIFNAARKLLQYSQRMNKSDGK